jgi:hypothetical protein
MSRKNGTTAVKMKAIELILDSGVTILVKPLSPYTRQAVFKKLADTFPYPDEKEYEEQIEGSESPGATIPISDKSNVRYEEYEAIKSEADKLRNRGYLEAMVEISVEWPQSKEALIEQYKDQRSDLSAFMDLPDDEWLATLYHCLCASQGDIDEIYEAAHDQLDIMEAEPSEDDIHSAWRVFRVRVSRSERSGLDKYTPLLQEITKLRRQVQFDSRASDGS